MRYRVILINGSKRLASRIEFSNRKSAFEWADQWRATGAECEILDKKKKEIIY